MLQFLGVYVPNCGGKGGFDRRRAWDDDMKLFVSAPRAKPLVLCGDLNVAPEFHDVSHPKWFRCFLTTADRPPSGPQSTFFHFNSLCRENNCLEAPDPGDRGQPGFTPNEQARFADITAAGGLVDAFRLLHPSAGWEQSVTWRGAAGKDVPESGRYYNKGMRIDLFMIQGGLKDRVDAAEVCGRGANMEGFLGSDHSPVVLRLRPGEYLTTQRLYAAAAV